MEPRRNVQTIAQESLLRAELPLKLAVKSVFNAVSGDLSTVEDRIRQQLSSDAKLLSEIAEYLLDLGGKRVRPVMTILSARLFKMTSPNDTLIDTAAGIELIHMATLLHDDIIDESPTRRRQTSAYKRYGVTPTLLTGDFLLVKAFGLCAKLDRFIIEQTERACVELTEGELLEGVVSLDSQVSLEDYLDVIGKKTASLFSLATASGSFIAGASRSDVDHLYAFGRHAGIAFQMVDDILDITADEDLLGKPAGTDLRQKTPSLVNILWILSGDPAAKEYFAIAEPSTEQAAKARQYLERSEIIAEAKRYAQRYADQALAALAALDPHKIDERVRKQFATIVRYTLDRCL